MRIGACHITTYYAHRAHCLRGGSPGTVALQSGNVSNLLRFIANQHMSRWSANETEDAMKRIIVVAAALLATALSTHAAPVKKYSRVVHGRVCHEIALTKNDVVAYALGIASGQNPFPQMERLIQCAPRSRQAASSHDSAAVYDAGPSTDSSPDMSPQAEPGPDTAGMNTSTNPTWPDLNQ